LPEHSEVRRGISCQGSGRRKEKDINPGSPVVQVAGDDETITTVIPFAADDDDMLPCRITRRVDEFVGTAAAGILHEDKTGDAVTLDRRPIEALHHFRRCEKPHGITRIRRIVKLRQ
jgi:hypothetical protein